MKSSPSYKPGAAHCLLPVPEHRVVLPNDYCTWEDEGATNIGYVFCFNGYLYKPEPLRSLEEIRKDIVALEKETEGLLNEIINA